MCYGNITFYVISNIIYVLLLQIYEKNGKFFITMMVRALCNVFSGRQINLCMKSQLLKHNPYSVMHSLICNCHCLKAIIC